MRTNYQKKIKMLIRQAAPYSIGVGLLFFISGLILDNRRNLIISTVFLLFGFLYYRNVWKSIFLSGPKSNWKKSGFKIIQNINNNSFEIVIKESAKDSILTEKHLWEEIESAELTEDNTGIIFLMNSKKEVIVERESIGWYGLLRKIAALKIISSNIRSYVKEFWRNLSGCEICGKIAVENNVCLSCNSEVFNQRIVGPSSNRKSYTREEQLELFSPESGEEVNFYSNEYDGFDRMKDWKPLVTEKEISEYQNSE